MERTAALEAAKKAHSNHMAVPFQERVWMKPEEEFSRFGYRHGWYHVDSFAFNDEEITGDKYDSTQGGWAYL